MPGLSRAAFLATIIGMIATTTLAVGQAQPAARHPVLASAGGAAHV